MIYYVETNLISICIALLMLYQGRSVTSKRETSRIIFNSMLILLILFCCSDISAIYFKGKNALGVQISNCLYLAFMGLGDYVWFLYVLVRIRYTKHLKRTILWTCIPMAILCILIALNPVTNYFFTVDSECFYHRGTGVLLTWIVEWGYLLSAFVLNVIKIQKEKSLYKKVEYRGYLIFVIPMAIAAICQMVFYGITTLQVGFTIAMLMVFLSSQQHQVRKDELTGLNNRNAFYSYKDSLFQRVKEVRLTLFMIDVDHFKSINDTYGHLTGDLALRNVADILKYAVVSIEDTRLLLYRYAGDEFVIVGSDISDEIILKLKETIASKTKQVNAQNHAENLQYELSMSIGYSEGICHNVKEFNVLLNKADKDMYVQKQGKKKR